MKNSPLLVNELSGEARRALQQNHHGFGLLTFVATLFLLSVLAGLNPTAQFKTFRTGDVADSDVVAQRGLRVEDAEATKARQNQAALRQPNVFDLSVAEISPMRTQIFGVLKKINDFDPEAPREELLNSLRAQLGESVGMEDLAAWSQPNVQEYVLNSALPWMEARLGEGVLGDMRLALSSKNGALIRDLENGSETLRSDGTDLRDISSLLAFFGQRLRAERALSPQARKAVLDLFSPLVMPTLTLNREATLALGEAAARTAERVYYDVRQGEVVVRQGERVTREAQLKLQSLYKQREGTFHSRRIAGLFVFSLLLSVGLFATPGRKPEAPLQGKDFYFMSLLLLSFGLAAKAAYLIVGRLVQPQEVALVVHFFPVAGAAGMVALIFGAKRYCVLGLLVSLFSCVMFKAGLPLFLFFFLSAMCATWLVVRAQSRQDVAAGIIPLCVGTILVSLGSGWLEGFRGANVFLWLAGIAALNAFVSVIMLFAFSPIIELIFRYTTRFRLMELMNLEQPLLQELMVAVPGTYHHSLVVSNMVEAGAKAVGANSLLCKVGALYHDVGKLAYPEYYIENQFAGFNRHDKLAPAMSALILLSHVKKGTELAREHHLGDEIRDFIAQHHGTSLIKYFYGKAKELGENPRIEDYCYPGPRPQTRETAIVMLADAVEASSRTLSDPTPARIANHVDAIMKGIFAEGQLDESELTFKDLHKLAESFSRILTGLFHQRIAYPDVNRKPGRDKEKEEQEAAKPAAAEANEPEGGEARGAAAGRTADREEAAPQASERAVPPAPETQRGTRRS